MKKLIFSFLSFMMLFLASCSSQNNSSTTSTSTIAPGTEQIDKTETLAPSTGSTAESESTKPVDDYKLKIAGPKGAPSIGISELLHTHGDEYVYDLSLAPDALGALFAKMEHDVIIAPVNLGAKMYKKNNNSGYKLGAMLTWGNLYLASQRPDFKLSDINGAEVTIFGAGTVNEVVLKHVFFETETIPAVLTPLGSTSETQAKLISDPNAIVLVAEPALTAAKLKVPGITSISIQDLFEEATNHKGFPQAAVFVKEATINEHKTVVDTFLERVEASATFSNTNTKETAQYAEELGLGKAGPLTKAIPNCNIRYKSAKESKAELEYLVSLDMAQFGGANPVDAFYYGI